MTWPWEQAVKPDVWHQAYLASEEHVTALRDEVRRLTDVIVELRRDGFNPGPPTSSVIAEPDLPDAILQAIAERAPAKSELERELYRYAKQLHGSGMDPEKVARLVYVGGEPEEA